MWGRRIVGLGWRMDSSLGDGGESDKLWKLELDLDATANMSLQRSSRSAWNGRR